MTRMDLEKFEEVNAMLRKAFDAFKTDRLVKISAERFKKHIFSQLGEIDASMEGFSENEVERQRDLSIKFHWGHNHDFGEFILDGRMKDRHFDLLSNFFAMFPLSAESFEGKFVFDIGCWTGGTTLTLAALGSKVFAIEEVKKYVETVNFLAESFGIERQVTAKSLSIYECSDESFHDKFDMAYFPGVIYHLTDPLVALRIVFNSLKVGGTLLIESMGIDSDKPICKFVGSLVHSSGTREQLDRGGWNWFVPSPSALFRMMRETGFEEISVFMKENNRIYGYGKKLSEQPMCKAGISISRIK